MTKHVVPYLSHVDVHTWVNSLAWRDFVRPVLKTVCAWNHLTCEDCFRFSHSAKISARMSPSMLGLRQSAGHSDFRGFRGTVINSVGNDRAAASGKSAMN
jgi:hypothetical protein